MCLVEKCCYFISMELGCIWIGIASFLFSGSILFESSMLLFATHQITLNLSEKSLLIIYSTTVFMSACNMAAAMLLMIGVIKRKAGYLLCYFSLGIFTTILSQLTALLVLLAGHWAVALVIFVISLIYIHFLVVVHMVYDTMQRKDVSGDGDNTYDRLEESLVDSIET